MMESNVSLNGKVTKSLKDGMYIVSIPRMSGVEDMVVILPKKECAVGDSVSLHGEFRTRNNGSGSMLYVKETAGENEGDNIAVVTGIIGKYPVLRVMSKNYALDLSVRTNASDGTEVYVPVVCLGECAKAVQGLTVGCKVTVAGRVQSRVFTNKRTKNKRTWYELVAFKVSILEAEENVKKLA